MTTLPTSEHPLQHASSSFSCSYPGAGANSDKPEAQYKQQLPHEVNVVYRPRQGSTLGTSVPMTYGSIDNGVITMNYKTQDTPLLSDKTPLLSDSNRLEACSVTSSGEHSSRSSSGKRWKFLHPLHAIKSTVLLIIVVVFTIIYASKPDLVLYWQNFSVADIESPISIIDNPNHDPILKFYLKAPTLAFAPTFRTNNLHIIVKNLGTNKTLDRKIVIAHPDMEILIPPTDTLHYFNFENQTMGDFIVQFEMIYNLDWWERLFSVYGSFATQPMPASIRYSVIYAAIILIGVYTLICFELVHRTVAAMVGALVSIATLAWLDEKPGMDVIISWIDFDTISLLFGMMVLVAILVDTGIFDWFALMAYKLAGGKTWPLITWLCIFSAVVSAFLDHVTTILLLTPITIRLCEVLDIDPKHVMMAEVLFSNIGGTATGIGDPPNVIILSNKDIQTLGIGFGTFTLHMCIGSILACFVGYALLRLMYRKKEFLRSQDPPVVAAIVTELEIWKHQKKTIVGASREEIKVKEQLQSKINILKQDLHTQREIHKNDKRHVKKTVAELAEIYYIRDYVLLVKSSAVLIVVILAFFLQSFVAGMHITLGWIPMLGAIWLLVMSDLKDLDAILHRIEWATLLFFGGLFVMIEALTKLGLIDFITSTVTDIVMKIPVSSRLAVAIIVILWISAIASSFIDNIPYTTAMIPVIVNLSGNPDVALPLEPLIWALAFGACFGGNGTLIGASANVVSAGIAETHGHGFTFMEFFKVGFPMMLTTTTVSMFYLLLCHVAGSWNGPDPNGHNSTMTTPMSFI